MKQVLILLTFFLASLSASAQSFPYLNLKSADGKEQSVNAERLKIVFTTDNFMATDASGKTTQVALSNLASMYFSLTPASDAKHGDVNRDGVVDVSDVTTLISMILGDIPVDKEVADIDGNGTVDVSDVTALINLILS